MASIRQQINIAVSSRTVWTTLTTAEGWKRWWAEDARLEARPGGRIVLTVEGDLRPTRKLEIAWDATSPAKTKGTRLQFSISRDGDETRLALVHSGGGILDDEDQRADLEKEWRNALRALRSSLEDESAA